MSDFSLMMVPEQTIKHYGYAVQRKNAQIEKGAVFENVEYEIVTQGSDPTSIRDWKLENLAVFDMKTVKEVDNKNDIDWTNYVVFEFVARRNDNNNTNLNVVMVTDGDGDGKVYEKDEDGFGVFGKRSLLNLNINDDISIASSVEKGKDKDNITTPERLPGPGSKKKPEPELKDIVLRASKVDDEENRYGLYFHLPKKYMNENINGFSFEIQNTLQNVEINKENVVQAPSLDTKGLKVFIGNPNVTIDSPFFQIGLFTTSINDINNIFTNVKVLITEGDSLNEQLVNFSV